MNWLKTRNSPVVGRVEKGQLHTGQGVADVEHAPGLAALAVDRQGVADHGLDAEAVEYGAEDAVVVEAGGQVGVQRGLLGLLAVDDALVEVGGTEAPDPTGELRCCGCRAPWTGGRRTRAASGRAARRCGPCG